MAFRSLEFQPGLNAQLTPTLDRSGWFGAVPSPPGAQPPSNLVRWNAANHGAPEVIGGWNYFLQPSVSLVGVCRGLHAWSTLAGLLSLGMGTTARLYVSQGGVAYEITPLVETSNHASPHPTDNCITTSAGSAVVAIADANYSPSIGDWVEISGATAVGGLTISGPYAVQTLVGGGYTILAASHATGAATGGGTSIVLQYLLPTGPVDSNQNLGWGINTWGYGPWGTPRPSGTEVIPPAIWSIDNWGEEMVSARIGTTIYDWMPSNGVNSRATPITNAPPAVNGILVSPAYQQIIAWGTNVPNPLLSTWGSTQDPMMICWTDFSNYNSWFASASNAAGSFRLTQGSQILQAARAQNQVLILTDTSLVAMQFIGLPLVYGFQEMGVGCGGVSPRAMAVIGQQAFWWGNQEFYNYNGTVQPIPCYIRDLAFNNVQTSQVSKIVASVNAEFSEIIWEFPSLNSTENDSYISYNYVNQTWGFGTTVSGFPLVGRTCRIDQGVFGFPIATDVLGNVWFHETGYSAGGSPMPWSLQSGFVDMAEGEEIVFMDWIIPDQFLTDPDDPSAANASVEFTLYGQTYPSDTFNASTVVLGPYTVSQSTQYIPVRLRARQIAIQFSNQAGIAPLFWRLGRVRVRTSADGRN